MVYVISQKNKPLMPCSNPIARLLLKQYSTYQMWKIHGDCLSKQYWKHYILWSDGYFACRIGQVSQKIIEKYIQNQG